MKLWQRNVALVLGALVIVGFIPDTLNIQTPRTETIIITPRNINTQPIVLPPIPIESETTLTKAQTDQTDDRDTTFAKALTDQAGDRDQRTSSLEIAAAPRPYESLELYIHLPPNAAKNQPLRVLFVLHGMGGRGVVFSQGIISQADKYHWLLVAPTIPYNDYMNPAKLLEDDIRYTGMLADMMNHLPKKLGLKLRQHALVYGFSRGAQLAHRFAFFFPERTEAVAAISAGSFTLPTEYKNGKLTEPLLKLPYGVGDLEQYVGHTLSRENLKQVSFLIEVGQNDSEADDVPRQFDPYVGKTRIDRAQAFQYALTLSGIKAQLIIFPGTAHEMTNEMIKSALQFLRDEELLKNLKD